MTINVEIRKKDGESTSSVLRRFTKKVQSAGIINRLRSIRYEARPLNDLKKKTKKLESLRKTAEIEKLIKLGKIQPGFRGKFKK